MLVFGAVYVNAPVDRFAAVVKDFPALLQNKVYVAVQEFSAIGELAGSSSGTHLVTSVTDFEKVATLGFGQVTPVVNDQQVDPAEPVEQLAMAAIGPRRCQVAEQFGSFEEQCGKTVAASLMRNARAYNLHSSCRKIGSPNGKRPTRRRRS